MMTKEEKRIEFAKLCGWKYSSKYIYINWIKEDIEIESDPLEDHNCIYEALKILFPNQLDRTKEPIGYYNKNWYLYLDNLKIATGYSPSNWIEYELQMATAEQKVEAILRTFNIYFP